MGIRVKIRNGNCIEIMHDHMLPILFRSSLIQKISTVALTCTLSISLSVGKHLVSNCQATDSSPQPVIAVDELYHFIQTLWAAVSVHAIQSPITKQLLLLSVGLLFWIFISQDLASKFLENSISCYL